MSDVVVSENKKAERPGAHSRIEDRDVPGVPEPHKPGLPSSLQVARATESTSCSEPPLTTVLGEDQVASGAGASMPWTETETLCGGESPTTGIEGGTGTDGVRGGTHHPAAAGMTTITVPHGTATATRLEKAQEAVIPHGRNDQTGS